MELEKEILSSLELKSLFNTYFILKISKVSELLFYDYKPNYHSKHYYVILSFGTYPEISFSYNPNLTDPAN